MHLKKSTFEQIELISRCGRKCASKVIHVIFVLAASIKCTDDRLLACVVALSGEGPGSIVPKASS